MEHMFLQTLAQNRTIQYNKFDLNGPYDLYELTCSYVGEPKPVVYTLQGLCSKLSPAGYVASSLSRRCSQLRLPTIVCKEIDGNGGIIVV